MLTPFQIEFLKKRGIPENEMEAFVSADISLLLEPSLMKGVVEAGYIIEEAIKVQKNICIVGDFDCDGITATALMMQALEEIGAKKLSWHINSRFDLGYGLQVGTIEEILSERLVDLIITVDNGITSNEAVEFAREKGITVIITDHHEPPNGELPNAEAIINPKQINCQYPSKNLAGVGVAFKLIQYLYQRKEMPRRALRLLDIVAIGTVGDVMTLLGENRVIVKNGLKLINWEKARPGIQAIKQVFSIKGEASTYHLGFCFSPALNAQGRIKGVPKMAVELLMAKDFPTALNLASQLYEINKERQEMTKRQVEEVLQLIGDTTDKFILFYGPEIHEGIVGLVAGRVKEKYNVPTLILTTDKEEGLVKGSARSVDGFDIKKHLIDECQDLLLKGGGHAMAAGVTTRVHNIPLLHERLKKVAESYPVDIFQKAKNVDFIIDAKDITLELVDEIQELAPFGVAFPSPTFQLKEFAVKRTLYMGNMKQHLKLVGERGLEVLAFGLAQMYQNIGEPIIINPVGQPSKNEWQGNVNIQFTVKDEKLIV